MKKYSYTRRYNVQKTFEYNKERGPFETVRDKNKAIQKMLGIYGIETDFFGFKTRLPIGVAAGPLYNKKYMIAAARDGFEVITWKTFRSVHRLAHRNDGTYTGHNIVFLPGEEISNERMGGKIEGTLQYRGAPEDVSITNSFGMPSSLPQEWMPDITELESYAQKNKKCIIASVVGTPQQDGTLKDLARDYAFVARCAENAGAKIIEVNLSCPNVSGKEGMIFKTCPDASLVVAEVRASLAQTSTKLLMKVGYADEAHYKGLLESCAPYIDGIVAINTIAMEIIDKEGNQALPGGKTSGTCGKAIIGKAVDAVRMMVRARSSLGNSARHVKIIGCGGVTDARSFFRHIDAGAEFVLCATSALFNPDLPMHIATEIRAQKIRKKI